MRNLFYAILAALLVSSVAFARTIVLPVRPVTIDDNGDEIFNVWPAGATPGTGWTQASGYLWVVDFSTGAVDSSYGCYLIGSNTPTSWGSCPSAPTFGNPTPWYTELR